MAFFGGAIRLTVNGAPLVLRGKVEIMVANLDKSIINNEDNSVSFSAKPVGYEADVMFEATKGFDFGGLLMLDPGNITIIEDQAKTIHMFTSASFAGRPKVDRNNGEVAGLKIVSPIYQAVAA